MPLHSMTGFGQAEAETPEGTFRVEFRGVNNRFLELQLRMPRSLANLEQKIKKIVTAEIARGSVTVFVTTEREQEKGALTYDEEAVDAYVRILREIQDRHHLDGSLSLAELVHFSDLVKMEATEVNEARIWKCLQPVLKDALADFQNTRRKEAVHIIIDLKKRQRELVRLLKRIRTRIPSRLKNYIAELRKRINSLLEQPVEEQRLAQEVAVLADRLDIAEECTRLSAHILRFDECIAADGPIGKRMNFLLQEMNREANTIGAKANDVEISHYSVALKENVEKLREQIQNIE
ncbi:MAG: YicC family protein [Chitinivibrionales bacterium]|nr:YicC family protein [Chitinivibrionales bacterium]